MVKQFYLDNRKMKIKILLIISVLFLTAAQFSVQGNTTKITGYGVTRKPKDTSKQQDDVRHLSYDSIVKNLNGTIPGVQIHLGGGPPPKLTKNNTQGAYNLTDTIPIVVYKNISKKTPQTYSSSPAYFINGKLITDSDNDVLSNLFPENIESINFKKTETEINGKKYSGEIHIKTKLSVISLTDLTTKYVKLKENLPTIFMIDNKIIKTNSNDIIVVEKNILKIEVDEIITGNLNVNIVRLITRTKENVEKENKVYLRGQNETE